MITSVSVGTAAVQVLSVPSGTPYKFVAVGNTGSDTAYLKLTPDSTPVTSLNGIPLPAGASLLCDQDAQKELFNAGVTAICASGESTTLSVQAY
jgi:hypothetical protein